MGNIFFSISKEADRFTDSFLRNSDGQLTCGGVAFRGTKEEVFDYKFAPPDAIRGIGHRK